MSRMHVELGFGHVATSATLRSDYLVEGYCLLRSIGDFVQKGDRVAYARTCKKNEQESEARIEYLVAKQPGVVRSVTLTKTISD